LILKSALTTGNCGRPVPKLVPSVSAAEPRHWWRPVTRTRRHTGSPCRQSHGCLTSTDKQSADARRFCRVARLPTGILRAISFRKPATSRAPTRLPRLSHLSCDQLRSSSVFQARIPEARVPSSSLVLLQTLRKTVCERLNGCRLHSRIII